MYPEISTDQTVTLETILENSQGKPGRYGNVINFTNQLRINRQLMDLVNVNIPEEDVETIQAVLDNPNDQMNSLAFLRLYNEDSLGNSIPNTQMRLHSTFNNLKVFKKK